MNEALRLIRVYHDINQSQLSMDLGISKSHLSEIESGKKKPTLELLEKYSERFGLPVSSLVFFSENIERPARMSEAIRAFTANKVISLLSWVENKTNAEDARTADQGHPDRGRKVA